MSNTLLRTTRGRRNNLFVVLTCCMAQPYSSSLAAASHASHSAPKSAPPPFHVAGSHEYASPPDDYVIEKVIVVHRHGDRSQIARSIGLHYPESSTISDVWKSRMPSLKALQAMASVAQTTHGAVDSSESNSHLHHHLYAGEDSPSFPFAQLTHKGVIQLVGVGKELRRRYFSASESDGASKLITDTSLSSASSLIYARSTNMCRTLQSLRALLTGLYATDPHDLDPDYSADISADGTSTTNVGVGSGVSASGTALHDASALQIRTRPKSSEVMFPAADGPCEALVNRRAIVFPPDHLDKHWPNFAELEAKMKSLLGYQDKVSWLSVKEILTCHKQHDIPFPNGVTHDDEGVITSLAGWMWGRIYSDKELNRLAIGRFVREMSDDLRAALGPADGAGSALDMASAAAGKKILIYSGHDSTLVPLLCALECFDGHWPPYASYLSLEIAQSRETGERFVRALYNDQEVKMLAQPGVWCSFDVFVGALEAFSLRQEEYKSECASAEKGQEGQDAQSAYAAEVKATIG